MVRITVNTISPVSDDMWTYQVEITESNGSGSQTRHKISDGIVGPEDFVKKSFQFLLKRENKDSILREFNINQIREHFPEYEKEIKKML